MKVSLCRAVLAGVAVLVTGAVTTLTAAAADAAAAGCSAQYAVTSQWNGGFTGSVTVTNLGDPASNWVLGWSFAAGQQVTQGWNATFTQSGSRVEARQPSWAAPIATGASVNVGFNGSWTGSNPAPTSFTLNGVTCTGATTPPTTPPTTTPTTPPPSGGTLPTSFRWSSSGILVSPKSDASHTVAGIKDPTIVYAEGRWHVFASTANASGYNLVYFNFTDFAQAGNATQYYLDRSPIGTGYRAAPEVFYFAPTATWYLVYQTGLPSYSTTKTISDPNSWSAPKNFQSSMPSIISQNIGSGYWVDFWVVCDSVNCYLYSSDDNGHLYRAETTLANFPNGFTNTRIEMQDANRNNVFEASNIYKVKGSNTYLLLVEAIGSDGRRYFRSWTADGLNGGWRTLAATESNPFARANNVTFTGTPWTQDISHGEMVREGTDQTLTIDPCRMRYLYQGLDPSAGGDYNSLPWRLGLLTQTNSSC
jgi:hypothetical protein